VLHLGCLLFEPVLQLDVSVYKSFCAAHRDVSVFYCTRACAALMRVRLQELSAATGRVYKSMCCTCACLSIYKSFALHLDVSTYKSSAHAVPVGLQSTKNVFGWFWLVSKRLLLFYFMKQDEKQPKRIEFRFFSAVLRIRIRNRIRIRKDPKLLAGSGSDPEPK
jgi:hypothetical protein